MFEIVRVALFATFSVGAATAVPPAHLRVGSVTEVLSPPPTSPTDLVDTPPREAALSADDAIASLPPAKSLKELVGRTRMTGILDEEQECLAVAVYFESKGEPLEGQLAVARTLINRTTSSRFGHSLCGVIHQRGQFSFMRRPGMISAIHREAGNWRTAVAVASIAMRDLWAGPVRDALFFHAKHVSPRWGMTRLASVGNQVFYR